MASYAKDPEDDSAPDLEAPNVTALDLAKTILAGLDANDLASFDASVAPDVKLYALTEKKESSGKDSTLQKMGEISSKLKGKLGSQEFAQLASDERVRALVVASMMGMKIRLGFDFTVRRGVLVEVGIGAVRRPARNVREAEERGRGERPPASASAGNTRACRESRLLKRLP